MPTFVVGDVHGHVEPLVRLLRDAGLVDERIAWSGADARLWFIGDLVDRGPDGVGALRAYLDQFWNRALTAFKAAVEQGHEEVS